MLPSFYDNGRGTASATPHARSVSCRCCVPVLRTLPSRPTSAPAMGVPRATGAPILLAHNVHDVPDAQFDISWPAKRSCGKFILIPPNILNMNMMTFMFQHRAHLYPIQAPALSIVSLPATSPMPLKAQNHDSQSPWYVALKPFARYVFLMHLNSVFSPPRFLC
jgi:hypothetical protein